MATKLYLATGGSTKLSFVGQALRVDPAFWDGSSAAFGYSEDIFAPATMGTAAGNATPGTVFSDRATVAGPTSGICAGACVSLPLAAAFTLSGTITFNIWASESSASANAGLIARVYKLSALDGLLTQVLGDTADGVELGTSAAAMNWTGSPTSTDFAIGDRIVLFLGADDAGGTMASGFNVRIFYASADGSNGGSYVQLNENVTFVASSTPAGSKLYLRDTASTVDAGVDEREMWTDAGSGSADTAVRNTAAGPTSALQLTKTAGGTALEWYSKRLAEFSLAGAAAVRAFFVLSVDSEFVTFPFAELARVDDDGTNAVVWAFGFLPENVSGLPAVNAIPGVSTGAREFHGHLLGAPLAFIGHRLRLRLYLDENYWRQPDDMLASRTVTMDFNGTTDATQAWLQLSETVSEYTPPGPVPGPFRIQTAAVY